MQTAELDYWDNDLCCRGFIAYPKKIMDPRPAVLIAHDWGGRGDDACARAIYWAQQGYIGFALDMYGDAQVVEDKTKKRSLMTPLLEHRTILTQRIKAALTTLSQVSGVDNTRIAAIGYCFGGLCVLDLARSGAPIKGVVSVHGLLHAPREESSVAIRAKILVLHGYDDPLVKPEAVRDFGNEMTRKKVDWQIHIYGNTAHSFTNPHANDTEMGLHFNPVANKRAERTLQNFLNELFIG
ncbi:MAG: carboxymethylenebutenolidase [Legionella sp. 40-6]|nr:dienelactone hydrolase family protein [Legionella sp.]OJY16185.1 MAG: carboxymethylenebutenolidase [Legionella sp. 40-6]